MTVKPSKQEHVLMRPRFDISLWVMNLESIARSPYRTVIVAAGSDLKAIVQAVSDKPFPAELLRGVPAVQQHTADLSHEQWAVFCNDGYLVMDTKEDMADQDVAPYTPQGPVTID